MRRFTPHCSISDFREERDALVARQIALSLEREERQRERELQEQMRLQLRLDDEAAQLEMKRHIQEVKDEVFSENISTLYLQCRDLILSHVC